MTKLIAIVPKNARERVQVSLTRYHEHDLVDVRVYADNGEEWVATAKGVALRTVMLPALAVALKDAEREAQLAGLLPPRADEDDGG